MRHAAAILCMAAVVAAKNSSWVVYGGNIAKSAPAMCPGGKPAYQQFLMNELYDAGSRGLKIAGIPAFATQTFACGYTGADSAAGTFHDWVRNQSFGVHPSMFGEGTAKNPYILQNGGVPQNLTGGLAAHIEALEQAVSLTIPENYTGVLGLDYEGWQPVWDGFLFRGYMNASEELVAQAHPTWNATRVAAEAEAEFLAAAKAFYLTTIRTIKRLRPGTILGFYETPSHLWHSYWNPEYTAEQRAHNDAMDWLFDEVDILMPTIYLKGTPHVPSPYSPNNASIVRNLLDETQRIADGVNARHRAGTAASNDEGLPAGVPPRTTDPIRPIQSVPWAWMRAGGDAWLYDDDLLAEFAVPFEYPATSAVAVWGDPDVGNVGFEALAEYYNKTFQPFAAKFLEAQCGCAAQQCSSHGRCVANNTACACASGWEGSDCSKPSSDPGHVGAAVPITAADQAAPAAAEAAAVPPAGSTVCADGMAYCPSDSTCGQLTTGMWACCPMPNAQLCGNFNTCCPSGTQCDASTGTCF